jgi:hypothetical protein
LLTATEYFITTEYAKFVEVVFYAQFFAEIHGGKTAASTTKVKPPGREFAALTNFDNGQFTCRLS